LDLDFSIQAIETVGHSETSVQFNMMSLRHISEDDHLSGHSLENFKSVPVYWKAEPTWERNTY
jgi:hypothetical protein